MGMPPLYRFEMKNADDTLWYYVSGDDVLTSTAPKYMVDDTGEQVVSPEDWRNLSVGYNRNEKYHGVFRKFGVPVSFTFNAIKILQYVLFTDGCDGSVIWKISIRVDDWTYETLFTGELDLSTSDYQAVLADLTFKTNVLERGLPEMLKANENVPQEIETDSDWFAMYHDGARLNLKYSFINVWQFEDKGLGSFYVPVTELQHDGEIEPLAVSPIELGGATDSTAAFQKPWLIAKYDIDGFKLDINWVFEMFNGPGSNDVEIIFDFGWIHADGSPTTTHNIYTSPTVNNNNAFSDTVTWSFTDDIKAGDKIILIGGQSGTGLSYDFEMKPESRTFVTGNYKLPGSEILVIQYSKMVNKLFKKALGSSVNVLSDYLEYDQNRLLNYDNNPKWTVVTSGTAIRGLANPKIKTSIADVFQDMRRWGLGLGIEYGNIRIERLPYFYQADRLVYTLQGIKEIRVSSANDFLCKSIDVGYNTTTDPKEVNGRQDYHGKSAFSFPMNRMDNNLDWSSRYIASIFSLEYARGNIFKEKSNDTAGQYDNDIFLMELNGDPGTYNAGRPVLYRHAYNYMYGLLHPQSAYNFGLTPFRTFHFNSELLLAMSYGKPLQSGSLTYKTTDKNNENKSQVESLLVEETVDKPLQWFTRKPTGSPATPTGDFITPLFQPFMFEIEAEVPDNLLTIMEADVQNRYGVIRFPFKGQWFDMFINDIALNPETKGLYNIRGLSSPNNDLLKLIGSGNSF